MPNPWTVEGSAIRSRRYGSAAGMLEKLPGIIDQGDEIKIKEVGGWAEFMVLKIGNKLRIRGSYTYHQSETIRAAWSEYRRAANA